MAWSRRNAKHYESMLSLCRYMHALLTHPLTQTVMGIKWTMLTTCNHRRRWFYWLPGYLKLVHAYYILFAISMTLYAWSSTYFREIQWSLDCNFEGKDDWIACHQSLQEDNINLCEKKPKCKKNLTTVINYNETYRDCHYNPKCPDFFFCLEFAWQTRDPSFVLSCLFLVAAVAIDLNAFVHQFVRLTKKCCTTLGEECSSLAYFGKAQILRWITYSLFVAFLVATFQEQNSKQALIETHLGAFTLLLLWVNVSLSLGMLAPSLGIYISITSYVGKEVFRLILLYSTILVGNKLEKKIIPVFIPGF